MVVALAVWTWAVVRPPKPQPTRPWWGLRPPHSLRERASPDSIRAWVVLVREPSMSRLERRIIAASYDAHANSRRHCRSRLRRRHSRRMLVRADGQRVPPRHRRQERGTPRRSREVAPAGGGDLLRGCRARLLGRED